MPIRLPTTAPTVGRAAAGAAARRFLLGRLFLPLGIAITLFELWELYRRWNAGTANPQGQYNVPGYEQTGSCGLMPMGGPTTLTKACGLNIAYGACGDANPSWAGQFNPATQTNFNYLWFNAGVCNFGVQQWQKAQTWNRVGPLPGPQPAPVPGFTPVPRTLPELEPVPRPRPQPHKPGIKGLPAPLLEPAPEHAPWKFIRWTRFPEEFPGPRERSVRGPRRNSRYWPRVVKRTVSDDDPNVGTRTHPEPRPRLRPERPHRPPGPRTKERKVLVGAGGTYRLIKWAINAATEFTDYEDAIWWAIPRKYRKRKYDPNPVTRAQTIAREWQHIDWTKAFNNLIRNEIGDRLYGGIGRALKKSYRNNPYMTRPVGFQAGPAM